MKVGLLTLFQGRSEESDAEMYEQELALALEAEAMGFDNVMVVEHHFTDYSMSPDNAQVLAYIAGKTSKIGLFPAAFLLPWHDPIRVAEKAVLLDHLSGGRVVLGFGRGLARREFEAFRIDMAESRDRFDEAAEMILDALETGFIEGDGPHYIQPRTEIRPRPLKSFKGRSVMVGASPASLLVGARLGLAAMQFGVAASDEAVESLGPYRQAFREAHGTDAPPLMTADLMVCDRDAKRAEEYARQYQTEYWFSVMNHYEMLSHHFEQTKGSYDMYAELSETLRNDKDNAAADAFVDSNLFGDPAQIIDQLRAKYEIFGGLDLAVMASYSEMPYELVRSSLKLFADEVLPEIQSWA
jgi:alkanesulfonate monooxygenase SsuD/methylene tetrahydromethanopterin reductase-like flavin-dependent oxidoreductase (luciferase family)